MASASALTWDDRTRRGFLVPRRVPGVDRVAGETPNRPGRADPDQRQAWLQDLTARDAPAGDWRKWQENQATSAAGEWIAGLRRWDVFGTGTYRDQLRPGEQYRLRGPRPLEVVRRDVSWWAREFKRQTGRRVEAGVVAVESHHSGWPHVHGLLGLEGGLQDGDRQRLWSIWYERYGRAKIEEPRAQSDVAEYAAKYLVKQDGAELILLPERGSLTVRQLGLSSAYISPGQAA